MSDALWCVVAWLLGAGCFACIFVIAAYGLRANEESADETVKGPTKEGEASPLDG